MTTFKAARAVRSHAFTLPLPPREAFRFFEPEGERAWAPGWQPHYVYPADGKAEADMVFATNAGGEATLWAVTRHEPEAGVVEYLRVTPASRVARVTVRCEPAESDRTRVTVTYVYTGLDEAGNAYIRAMDEGAFRQFIESWATAILSALP